MGLYLNSLLDGRALTEIDREYPNLRICYWDTSGIPLEIENAFYRDSQKVIGMVYGAGFTTL